MTITDPAILNADPEEVLARLLGQGLTGVSLLRGAQVTATAVQGDVAVQAALTGWTPTTTAPGQYVQPLPDYIAVHVQHLHDTRDGIRNGTITGIGTAANQITQAQLLHILADIIDGLRLVNSRITGDS